jgi:cytochrome c553
VAVAKTAHLEPDPAKRGEWLALRGRWPGGIPPCGHCHGPTGLGVGDDFPPLAGQPAAYLEAQLNGWKRGLRPPGPLALMVLVSGRLDAADIVAVAKYYAELPDAAKAAAPPGGGR